VLGDLQKELVRIWHEVSAIMEEANPALTMRTEMILATVWLGVIELRIRAEQDPEKRKGASMHSGQEETKSKEPSRATENSSKVEPFIPNRSQGERCPDCGGKIIRSGGCPFCPSCGWSRC